MYNLSVISSFGLDVSFQTEKFCELYADMIPNTPKESIRVLWVMEPNEVSGFRQNAITNHKKFDLIFSNRSVLLPVMIKFQPFSAKICAHASPNPEVAPVIRTTFSMFLIF